MIAVRERWPFVPEVRLFHNEDKMLSHMLDRNVSVEPDDDAGAQTWYNADRCEAVVLMNWRGDVAEEHAMLAHEAVHVILEHFDQYIGEDEIGDEFLAYGVQVVAMGLIKAHDKWRERHPCEEAGE